MINLVNHTIELKPGTVENIIKFDVWWITPWGIIWDLDIAIDRCTLNDLDPNINIKALPVAIGESLWEPML